MKTLLLYVKIDDLSEPQFADLLDRALALSGNAGRDRMTFNVLDNTREEISAHIDKLIEQP
jgi:hypothetical protein